LNILHISDVHFGVRDPTAEQPRIAEALIEAVHLHDRQPDLCIFSGDLANFGSGGEFQTGEQWLKRLVREEWNSDLIVVPGNHDVDRSETRPSLFRACAGDESVYADWSRAKTINCDHLRPFFDWYKAARVPLSLGGEWINPFGLHYRKQADPFPVHVVCMNSSMFCCDDHDEKNLILDTKTLNAFLAAASREKSLVIVVAHHPLDFLTPWNRLGVETILAQENGAHLFLHGHKHETFASSRSDNTGFGLTTLSAGAAYQGTKWRQDFSFYEFDFDKREITPRVYKYELPSGKWIEDLSRSRSFVANIPLNREGSAAPAGKGPDAAPRLAPESEPAELTSPSIAPAAPDTAGPQPVQEARTARDTRADPEQLAQEVDARRHAASNIQSRVLQYFSEMEIDAQHYYAVTSRIKRAERIIEKFNDRKSGNPDYKLEGMTDICGFRIVTRYQDEIPNVVAAILAHMEEPEKTKSPFRPDRQIVVEINNSRMEADSLSLVEPVRAICNQSSLKPQSIPRVRDTGYSSIHFLGTVATTGGYHVREMRVEIQIRSAFEDAWGEIDHHIDYRERRGKKEIPRNKHLNVLKSMVDGLISYVDLIKKQSNEFRETLPPPIATSRSINTPQDQMNRLTGLPAEIFQRVKQAFEIWSRAYASREGERVNPDLFKSGANAFEALLKDFAGQPPGDKKLAAELDYVSRIEYAYMLQYTGEDADIQQAEKVYINILHDRPDDVTANYRLGALYRKLESLDKSKVFLDRALNAVASGVEERIDKSHFLYDSLRREIGLTEWRISEDETRSSDARLTALLVALKTSYDVILNLAVPDEPIGADTRLADLTQLSAINDFLYYRCYLAVLSGDQSGFPIAAEEEQKYRARLYDFYKSRQKKQHEYNFIDTLLRLYIDDKVKAPQLARDLISVLEKSVLEKSPNQTLPESLSIRWYGALVTQLNADQRDALTYAYEFLRKPD
jgi:ppGpp synthetase/RelA/SpoT-type nucleotidyltranferase/predicted phosphodiesterase